MELKQALKIASEIVNKLAPYCSRIEIAGSIRRKKQFPRDIDIVCIPSNQGQFIYALQQLGKIKMGGQKLIRCDLSMGVSLDVYVATLETWATLLLIRTGSKEHNIKLCALAKRQGMILHADGRGLVRPGAKSIYGSPAIGEDEPVKCDTEESIFKALGLKYLEPEERK